MLIYNNHYTYQLENKKVLNFGCNHIYGWLQYAEIVYLSEKTIFNSNFSFSNVQNFFFFYAVLNLKAAYKWIKIGPIISEMLRNLKKTI